MKIQAVLLASAAAMFASADLVAGEWLKNSPGQSYADYCGPNVGKETYYICFRSKTSILKEFQSDSSFQGYFAPDLKGFVVLGGSGGAVIKSKRFTIQVGFMYAVDNIGVYCGGVSVYGAGEKPETIMEEKGICQPGGKVVQLPF